MDIKKLIEHLKIHGKKLDAEFILVKKAEFIEQTFSELFKIYNELCDWIKTPSIEDPKILELDRLYDWSDDKHQIKILKQFLSHDYEPPDDLRELLNHISSIFLYQNLFRQTGSIPSNVLLQFDLVLAKLIQKANVWVFKTGKDMGRTGEATKTKQKSRRERWNIVIDLYKELKELHPNKKPHTISKMIQKQLSTWIIPQGEQKNP